MSAKTGKENPRPADKFLPALFCLLIAGAAFIFGWHLIGEGDFLWHLKTGEIIFSQGLPRVDLYSFRTSGREWIDSQWLFQLIIYLVYRWFGFAGESWLLAFLLAGIWMILFRLVRDQAVYPVSFLAGLLALWGSSIRFNLRPEIFSWLLMVGYLFILERDRKNRSWLIALIPMLQLFWANLEGLWPIGLVILAAYLLEEVFLKFISRKERFRGLLDPSDHPDPKRILGLIIICALVSLFTPYHLQGFLLPLTLVKQVTLGSNILKSNISEFLPPIPYFRYPFVLLPFFILIAISGASFFLNRSQPRPSHWLLWLLFLFLALRAIRNLPFFCVYSAAAFGINFQEWFQRQDFSARAKRCSKILPALLGVGLYLFLLITAIRGEFYQWNKTGFKFGSGFRFDLFPVQACAFLREQGWKGKIFNQMAMSSYLIWAGYPDWKIYIDGRLEVYGGERLKRYVNSLRDYRVFKAEERLYNFDAVMTYNQGGAVGDFIRHLLSDPGWAPVYVDDQALIFFKDSPAQHHLVEKYRQKLELKPAGQ